MSTRSAKWWRRVWLVTGIGGERALPAFALMQPPPPEFYERARQVYDAETAQLVDVISQHHIECHQWPDGVCACACGAILSTLHDADVHLARMILAADVSPAPPAAQGDR